MIPYGNSIKNEDMPKPDARVRYADNMFGPAMFHYLPENADPRLTAKEQGFDMCLSLMADEIEDEDPLFKLYFEDGECAKVFAAWRPKAREGWKIAGCHDTEDGPMAVFLRPTATAALPASHSNGNRTEGE
jgi:hypothetical protein